MLGNATLFPNLQTDVRFVAGPAKSVRVIGKGDKERLVSLPGAFGAVFGFWLKDQKRGEFAFAKATGQKPVSSQAARAYLRLMLKKADIEKKDFTPQVVAYLYHQPRDVSRNPRKFRKTYFR